MIIIRESVKTNGTDIYESNPSNNGLTAGFTWPENGIVRGKCVYNGMDLTGISYEKLTKLEIGFDFEKNENLLVVLSLKDEKIESVKTIDPEVVRILNSVQLTDSTEKSNIMREFGECDITGLNTKNNEEAEKISTIITGMNKSFKISGPSDEACEIIELSKLSLSELGIEESNNSIGL